MSQDKKLATPSQLSAAPLQPPSTTIQPLISFSTIDAPSQRFYAVGIAVLVQAWKYSNILRNLLSSSSPSSSSPSSIAPQK